MKFTFPFFSQHPEAVYLDSAATTQKPTIFFETLMKNYTTFSMPAGKSLYSYAENTYDASREAQNFFKKFINVQENSSILLFPSATLIGAFLYSQIIKYSKKLIVSLPLDGHNAIIGHFLSQSDNITIQWYNTQTCTEADFHNSDIIYITAVSHVSGTLFDFDRFKKSKQKNQCWIVDGCQHLPVMPFDMQEKAADILFFSTHKTYGTYGMAPLFIHAGFEHYFNVDVPCVGENVLQKTFCGSTNIPGLLTSSTMLLWVKTHIYENNMHTMFTNYNKKIQAILLEKNFTILSHPNAIQILTAIPPKGINAHDYALMLNKYNICVRSGNLCAEQWFKKNNYDNAIRISFGIYNDENDIQKLENAIKTICL